MLEVTTVFWIAAKKGGQNTGRRRFRPGNLLLKISAFGGSVARRVWTRNWVRSEA